MKIRYYRGPLDGKVEHVQLPPGRNDVVVGVNSPKDLWKRYLDPNVSVQIKHARYVRTNHTHPDGAIFFEWDQPRGTKKY